MSERRPLDVSQLEGAHPEAPESLSVASLTVVMAVLAAGALLAFVAGNRLLALFGVGATSLALLLVDVRTLKRALTAVMVLEITFPIDQYLGLRPDPDRLSFVSGYNVSLTTFCLAVLGGLWIAEVGASRDARRGRQVRRLVVPTLIYAVAVLGSLVEATDLELAAFEIVILLQAIAVFLYMVHFVRTRTDFLFIGSLLVIGLAAQVPIVAATTMIGDLQFGPLGTRTDGGRPGGTLGDPNVLGGYLALVIPVAAGMVMSKVPHALRAVAVFAAFGGSIALLLTVSRGALLALAVAATVYVVVAMRRRWIAPWAVALLAGALVIAAIPLLPPLIERSLRADVGNGRGPLTVLAIEMIRDNWLLGVGANNFGATLNRYLTVDFHTAWISTIHNKYLLVWAETGVVAVAAYVALVAQAVRGGWPRRLRYSDGLQPLAFGMSAGILGAAVHMMFDIYHSRPQVTLLFLIAGLLIGWRLLDRPTTDEVAGQSVPVTHRVHQ